MLQYQIQTCVQLLWRGQRCILPAWFSGVKDKKKRWWGAKLKGYRRYKVTGSGYGYTVQLHPHTKFTGFFVGELVNL